MNTIVEHFGGRWVVHEMHREYDPDTMFGWWFIATATPEGWPIPADGLALGNFATLHLDQEGNPICYPGSGYHQRMVCFVANSLFADDDE